MNVQEIKSLDFDRIMYEVRMRVGFLKAVTQRMDPAVKEDERVLLDIVQPLVFMLTEFCMNVEYEEPEEEGDEYEVPKADGWDEEDVGPEVVPEKKMAVIIPFPKGGAQ